MGRQDMLSIYIPWAIGVPFFSFVQNPTHWFTIPTPLLHNTHPIPSQYPHRVEFTCVCNSCENTSKGQSILCFVIWIWSRHEYTIFFLLTSHFGTIVCFITFLPLESRFLHLWFHFSLFANNANSPHHAFVLLPFFLQNANPPITWFCFSFQFHTKVHFFFLHGIQLHEKSSNATSSNCHFCMVHKKKSEDLSLLGPSHSWSPSFGHFLWHSYVALWSSGCNRGRF